MTLHENNFRFSISCTETCRMCHCNVGHPKGVLLTELTKALLRDEFARALEQLEIKAGGMDFTRETAMFREITESTLPRCSALTHLVLSGSKVPDKEAGSLARAVGHLTSLVHLNLSWNQLHPEGVEQLAAGCLAKLSLLQHLNLSGNRVRARGLASLGEHCFARCPRLTHLILAGCWISLSPTQVWHGPAALALGAISTLQHFDLSDNLLGQYAGVQLGLQLRRLSALTHLDLSINRLNGSLPHIWDGVEQCSRLTSLNISDSPRYSYDAAPGPLPARHAAARELFGQHLAVLDLTRTRLPEEGLAFEGCLRLTQLTMVDCGLGEGGLATLLRRLPRLNSALKVLDLSSNSIGDAGAEGLAVALGSGALPALRSLVLRNNAIQEQGATALAGALLAGEAGQRERVRVDVAWNELGPCGARSLVGALEGGRVETLNLACTSLGAGCRSQQKLLELWPEAQALGPEVWQRLKVSGYLPPGPPLMLECCQSLVALVL